jgi:hypothetical protein
VSRKKAIMFIFGDICDTENLAIVVGPNLLKKPAEHPASVLEEMQIVTRAIRSIIDHAEEIFGFKVG